jgi:FKBP-type peptidyl-prolyl cis-trans isomerase FkpA
MKRIVIAGFLAFTLISNFSCTKDSGTCTDKTVQSEEGAILAFATTNGITATRHSSGMYYQIISAGSGATPTLASRVKAKYTGKYMDGTIFDSATTAVEFPLSGVIAGWQLGLPLIQKGGIIKLIIPSSFAYGCTGRSPIPPYAVLYFELTDVL